MRIHGRSGIAYLSRSAGDAASPVAFLSEWAITYTRSVFDVTDITSTQVVYCAGAADVSGSFSGYYDTATAQTYASAVDGQPRNLYLYPSSANAGAFFSGMVLPDYAIKGGTASACELTVTWAAEAQVTGSGLAARGTYPAVYAATYA